MFYLMMPSPATVKATAAAMLDALGDPAAFKGPVWSMDQRLIKLIPACGVKLVILDDFHHLIDRDRDRVLETVSDWLKVLIKKTRVPFLVVGIEGTLERILRSNAQLSRLFAVREVLRPFDWSSESQEFDRFVEYVEQSVQRPLSRELPRPDLVYRLHRATDGVIGNLMNLMRYAALRADAKQAVELGDLSWAFRMRLARHLGDRPDPFTGARASAQVRTSGKIAGTRRSDRRRQRCP